MREVQIYLNGERITGANTYLTDVRGLWDSSEATNSILQKSSGINSFFTKKRYGKKDIELFFTCKGNNEFQKIFEILNARKLTDKNISTDLNLQVGSYVLLQDFEGTYTDNTGTYTSSPFRMKGLKSTKADNDIDITFSVSGASVFDISKVTGFVWTLPALSHNPTAGDIILRVTDSPNSVTLESRLKAADTKTTPIKWTQHEFGEWTVISGNLEDFEEVTDCRIYTSGLSGTFSLYFDNLCLQDTAQPVLLRGSFTGVNAVNENPREVTFKRISADFECPTGGGELVGLDLKINSTSGIRTINEFPFYMQTITPKHAIVGKITRTTTGASVNNQYFDVLNDSGKGFRFDEQDYANARTWFIDTRRDIFESGGTPDIIERNLKNLSDLRNNNDPTSETNFSITTFRTGNTSALNGSNEGLGVFQKQTADGLKLTFKAGTSDNLAFVDLWLGLLDADSEEVELTIRDGSSPFSVLGTSEPVFLDRGVTRRRFYFNPFFTVTGLNTANIGMTTPMNSRFAFLTTDDTTKSSFVGASFPDKKRLFGSEIDLERDLVNNVVIATSAIGGSAFTADFVIKRMG